MVYFGGLLLDLLHISGIFGILLGTHQAHGGLAYWYSFGTVMAQCWHRQVQTSWHANGTALWHANGLGHSTGTVC